MITYEGLAGINRRQSHRLLRNLRHVEVEVRAHMEEIRDALEHEEILDWSGMAVQIGTLAHVVDVLRDLFKITLTEIGGDQ